MNRYKLNKKRRERESEGERETDWSIVSILCEHGTIGHHLYFFFGRRCMIMRPIVDETNGKKRKEKKRKRIERYLMYELSE